MTRALFLITIFGTLTCAFAGEHRTATKSPVREGRYSCVFAFGGQFFDSKPITLQGGKYQASSGEGTWSYVSATRTIKFLTGSLAQNFSASYVSTGLVSGGLKNKKAPAIVLKPSAAYKKRQGPEAAPLYCYLD